MKPTEELYYKYAGVLTSVVNSYAWDCPEIKDELFLQAQLVFCEACVSYDPNHPSGASFETWLRQQLKSISCVIRKASRGPSLVKNGNQSAVPVSMLAQNISRVEKDDDEDPVDISDVASNWYLDDYSKSLYNGEDLCEFPEEMHPYIKALKGDSLRIFQDYCRGKFNLKPQKFMTVAKRKAREVLNPVRLYRRLYINEGWSLERVRNAWRGLRGVFNAYNKGMLPMLINDPKFQPEEITKSNNPRYINFAKRHKISYWNYRSLVKRGIIPELTKGDESLDLSLYAATAC